ncbi:MAG: HD domain-containing protein [Lachnospiraceae bacterium]|nr:HD domain-containing protein [Lachnospiraceae bacterium]
MRYIKMSDARPGMSLAYNMYDADGHTLICSGSTLSQFYIKKLNEYGFDGVYINDELSQDIKIDSVISPDLRTEGIVNVRSSNIDGCKDVAKKIVDQVLSKDVLSLDLTDLRCFDGYTYAHSVNVAVLSCIIGFGMKMNEQSLEQLVMAGLLHDLGKLMIPPEILNKSTRLTNEEYEIMKTHSALSYEMIKERWDISSQVKAAVLYHHENVDGSGYPNGIDGDGMTLITKILHVADVYDALVSRRPYKSPYSPYEACEYLMGAGGIMFDPKVVEALLMCVPFYPKGTQVELSDSREGIIVENAGSRNLRPVLRLLDGSMLDLSEQKNYNLTILHGTNEDVVDPFVEEAERRKMLSPSKKYHIMIIDDMLINLHAFRGFLQNMYDLSLQTSVGQALLHLKRQAEPDLIILDMDMPEMNGIDAAAKIREITGDGVPLLFVIDSYDKGLVARCRRAGAAGYIVRPYKPVYVKAEIKRIIAGQKVTE